MKINKISDNINIFLKKNKLNTLQIKPLKNDASKRKYYRIFNKKNKQLLMDSSLEKKSLNSFIKISNWLNKNNFSAPRIFNINKKKGLLLLEDFGESKFSTILKKNKRRKLFYYEKAINLIISLSKVKNPNFLNKYSNDILYEELKIYIIWHLEIKYNEHKKEVINWIKIWKRLFDKINYKNSCVTLRDFHVDNIFYLQYRLKEKQIGLIDYQDSLLGHISYDIVSLLQDVRVFLSKGEQAHLYNYFLKNSEVNKDDFEYAYLVLGTQRLLKIIGIFKKLSVEQGKFSYMQYIPRSLKLLNRNLKNPIFNELRDWLDKNKKYE